MEHATSITIAAPPEAVWSVLERPGKWPTWDSGVAAVGGADGTVAVGQKLKIEVAANPGKAFPVKVAEVAPPRRMVFRGGMPLGLFTGTRTYTVEPTATGSTFTMHETYTGPLAPLISRSIPDLQPSFETFAAGVRTQAEQAVSA